MKHRIGLLALAAGFVFGGSVALATDIPPAANSASDFIRALKPEPAVKTRGLSLGTGAATPQKEPAVAAPRVRFKVEFEYNSARLSPEATRILDELGKALVSPDLAQFRFRLTGHTDAQGSADYNLQLSKDRARSVRDYLMGRYNVAAARLEATGRGKEELLDPSAPNSPINRRVEITNLGD